MRKVRYRKFTAAGQNRTKIYDRGLDDTVFEDINEGTDRRLLLLQFLQTLDPGQVYGLAHTVRLSSGTGSTITVYYLAQK